MENHQSPVYPLCQYPGIVACTSRIWEKYLSFGARKIYAKNASLNYNRDHNRYFAYIQSGMVTMSFTAANGNEKKQLICAEGSRFTRRSISLATRPLRWKAFAMNAACSIFLMPNG